MALFFQRQRIRYSGVMQILLGLFIVVVGVADRFHLTGYLSGFPARYVLSIWMGCWIFFTGVIGVCISMGDTYRNIKKSQVITYLDFTIISMLFAIALIACYSVSIGFIAYQEGSCKGLLEPGCPVQSPYDDIAVEKECDIRVKLAVIIMLLCVLELLVAIWAIYCCLPKKIDREYVIKPEAEPEAQLSPEQAEPGSSYVHVNLKPLRPVSIILTSNQEPAESI